jgi:type IV pilus assembly protein PilX
MFNQIVLISQIGRLELHSKQGAQAMEVKEDLILREQSGAALVIALIMIIILTLIGLASTFTSTFEIKLSGNKRGSTDAFYTAEGGAQSVLANPANFVSDSWPLVPNSSTLPTNLWNESIDKKLTSPTVSLPTGVNFAFPPQVTLYHTTLTGAPRNLGYGATGSLNYQYYIVDSIGRDQKIDWGIIGSIGSSCQLREKIVRLLPAP